MSEATAVGVDLGRGLVLPNAVGLASGTAGYGFELAQLIDLDRLGALYTKGTTAAPRDGNPPPRVAETGGGMLNSIGLQNPGVDVVAREYAPRWRGWTIRVIVNVAGGSVEEYVHCTQVLEDIAEVAGLELNISCPNISGGLDFGRDPDAAARLVAAVRAATERCIIVKLSPNVTDIAAVARAVEDGRRRRGVRGEHLHRQKDSSSQRPLGPPARHRRAERTRHSAARARGCRGGVRRGAHPRHRRRWHR